MPLRHPWIATRDGSLVATFPVDRTDGDTDGFWDHLEAHFDSGEAPPRFGVLLDLGAVRSSSPRARARLLQHLRVYDDFHTRHCIGLAVVVRSGVVRAAVQALAWVVPHRAAPMRVFDDVPTAQGWLRELGSREGAAATPP